MDTPEPIGLSAVPPSTRVADAVSHVVGDTDNSGTDESETLSSGLIVEKTGTEAWKYVLSLLTVGYALNIADRQVVYILLEAMKKDMALRDWQVGAIGGLSFAVIYAAMAIPIARLADRLNRARLIAVALAVWSVGTIAGFVVGTFSQLVAARVLVGLGESGFTPTAHSLISDTVPLRKRALGLGIFNTGQSVGGMLALAFGGVIADLWGWRAAFLVAGVPGIVVGAAIFLTVRDPREAQNVEDRPVHASFLADARELLASRAFKLFALGGGLYGTSAYGVAAFIYSFIARNHGEQIEGLSDIVRASIGVHLYGPGLMGPVLGLGALVAGVSSAIISGYVTDVLVRRDVRSFSYVAAVPLLMAVPVFLFLFTTPNLVIALILYTLSYVLLGFVAAPVAACVQSLARPSNRATASAMSMLALVGLGNALGPLLVGVLSDTAASGGADSSQALRIALLVVATIPISIASLLFLVASRHLSKELGTKT